MKSVFAFLSIMALSVSLFAGNCGPHNLVGEWTRKTELAATPDVKCGETIVSEKTVFTFVYKGGKVSGTGSRITGKSFKDKVCSAKSKAFAYPHAELISNGSLSIVSEDGAQVISDCDVSADRTKVKISGVVYTKTK